MAKVEGITVILTLFEVRAIHRALGKMAFNDYTSEAEAEAGPAVYNELTPYADTE